MISPQDDERSGRMPANAPDAPDTLGAPASAPAEGRPAPLAPSGGEDGRGRGGRVRAIGGLLLVFSLAGASLLGYWHFFLRMEESTDDAYVAGNLVRVSPQVSGSVREILADNTDRVRAGQALLRLDDTDADLALRRARAALAGAVRQTRSLMAESERLRSVVALRRKELDKAAGDYERRRDRKTAMAVSEEELGHARDNLAIAGIALRVAEDDLQRNYLLLQDKTLEEQPLVRQCANQMREAWLALKRCEIKSPVDGYVARRTAQVGMHVAPGAALMAVVPLHEVWVDANFKEVQLARMRIGQTARIVADIYGGAVEYAGVITGFSAGTGSSFSLLPPENATGNWIKIVQRVPVKIALNSQDLEKAPLLVGLSCSAHVDVRDAGGVMLAAPVPASGQHAGAEAPAPGAAPETAPLFRTAALDQDFTEIDREIAAVIKSNAAYNEHAPALE
jgi:membrane fusion protein (multidrug efflux system)